MESRSLAGLCFLFHIGFAAQEMVVQIEAKLCEAPVSFVNQQQGEEQELDAQEFCSNLI